MSQQLLKSMDRLVRVALIALVIVLGSQVTAGRATPQAATMQPMVIPQVFNIDCSSLASVTTTYAKLVDLATFSVQSPNSTVEMTFNGRIYAESFAGSTGAVFELRLDGAASPVGRARATLRDTEGGGGGVQASITGFFTGLAAGNHVASMWVRTAYGTATKAMLDPGCWSTDVLIVKEYTPVGFTYLPSVLTP